MIICLQVMYSDICTSTIAMYVYSTHVLSYSRSINGSACIGNMFLGLLDVKLGNLTIFTPAIKLISISFPDTVFCQMVSFYQVHHILKTYQSIFCLSLFHISSTDILFYILKRLTCFL